MRGESVVAGRSRSASHVDGRLEASRSRIAGPSGIIAVFFAFGGAALELWRTGDWEAAERAAFKAGFVGTGFGILVYLLGLITGLY